MDCFMTELIGSLPSSTTRSGDMIVMVNDNAKAMPMRTTFNLTRRSVSFSISSLRSKERFEEEESAGFSKVESDPILSNRKQPKRSGDGNDRWRHLRPLSRSQSSIISTLSTSAKDDRWKQLAPLPKKFDFCLAKPLRQTSVGSTDDDENDSHQKNSQTSRAA